MLKIQLAQPISFVLGQEPVSEVGVNNAHVVFEPDQEIPSEVEGQPGKIIKGKAVLRWTIVDSATPLSGVHGQNVECKLDGATSDGLRALVTTKSREHLSAASKKSRGA